MASALELDTPVNVAKDAPVVPKHKKYRRDKPWDVDGIDHWKMEPLREEDVGGRAVVDETAFSTLFPKYREAYLRQWWPQVTQALKNHHVACELDLIEGSMTVRTTRKTWDPYIIVKARDLLKLLARSVPFTQAVRVLEDDIACDIVKIGNIVRNKDRFVKRRQRLIGNDGSTLKAIELLTECYILVQGNTVACMGGYKGLKQARKVIIDCMNNIHPIYNIKEMMIKRELAKNPALAAESWDRFLPKFKRTSVPKKTPVIKPKKKTLFPPAQMPRKVDLQLESGEYFLKEGQRIEQQRQKKEEKASEVSAQRKEERKRPFQPPEEKARQPAAPIESDFHLAALKAKLQKSAPVATVGAGGVGDFLLAGSHEAAVGEAVVKKHKQKSLRADDQHDKHAADQPPSKKHKRKHRENDDE